MKNSKNNYIEELQQENTRLKKCNNELSDLAILRFNELDKATIKLSNAESVLKEIREYINNSTTRMETLNYQISDLTKKELLEIIDKVIKK